MSAVETIREASLGIYDEANPQWREFIGLLCSHHARFLVVGAHALAAHGRPRATQDIDILVAPTKANARRVCSALADFGFTALAKEVDAFATPD